MKKNIEDYELDFYKMYNDFSNTYRALNSFKINKNKDSFLRIKLSFFNEQIELYKKYLNLILSKIEYTYGSKEKERIKKKYTREFHFNKIRKLLEMDKYDLSIVLKIHEEELDKLFSLKRTDKFKQDKIYRIYSFLNILDDIKEDNDLYDIFFSVNIPSEFEDEKDVPLALYIQQSYHDKTYYEIARKAIKLYKGER